MLSIQYLITNNFMAHWVLLGPNVLLCPNRINIFISMGLILICLFEFGFGIFEAEFLFSYYFDDSCQEFWNTIISSCIINICVPIFTFSSLNIFIEYVDNTMHRYVKNMKIKVRNIALVIIFAQSFLASWAIFSYYMINNIQTTCTYFYTFYENEFEIYNMLHFVLFCFSLIILIIGGFLFFMMLRYHVLCAL